MPALRPKFVLHYLLGNTLFYQADFSFRRSACFWIQGKEEEGVGETVLSLDSGLNDGTGLLER